MLVLRLLFSFSDLRFSLPLGRMGHTDVATPPLDDLENLASKTPSIAETS